MKWKVFLVSGVIALFGLNAAPPVLASSFNCIEYRKPASNKSAKEAAKDIPSWAKGYKPCKNPYENGTDFAKRLMAMKYQGKAYATGATSEFSQIKKFGERGFDK